MQPNKLRKWLHGRLRLVSLPVYGERTLKDWVGHRLAMETEESRDLSSAQNHFQNAVTTSLCQVGAPDA